VPKPAGHGWRTGCRSSAMGAAAIQPDVISGGNASGRRHPSSLPLTSVPAMLLEDRQHLWRLMSGGRALRVAAGLPDWFANVSTCEHICVRAATSCWCGQGVQGLLFPLAAAAAADLMLWIHSQHP
jgi:hypothetical protein